jgi:NAD(P)-dependent dehydrogenase (short-subunit alcohol dehydrogenase family)
VETAFGPIDVWINNAMVSVFSPIRELTADDIKRVTEVTYLGAVHGTMAALRRMLPRNRGVIVQVGSALAYRGIRCRRRTAGQSTRSRDSTIRSIASCSTTGATSD